MTDELIVVGIDGSEPSKAALRWAVCEAQVRNASVEVVHAFRFPSVGLGAFGATSMPAITLEELEKDADEVVRETVFEVIGDRLYPPVTTSVHMGHPAAVLVEVARHADLLVVGTRGHGGFAGTL